VDYDRLRAHVEAPLLLVNHGAGGVLWLTPRASAG